MQWRSPDGRRFVQLWVSEATGAWVSRSGSVGRGAPVVELGRPGAEPIAEVAAAVVPAGYRELTRDDYPFWVVVQWPLKSLGGSQRDAMLRERGQEFLEEVLDERGLGWVDGFDVGARADGLPVQNLFCVVLDAERGAASAAATLRTSRLDATRAEIAWRAADGDDWTVTHPRRSNKIPGGFGL